ncbi:MAG: GNAT family N-acetyltransferase [Drouetiella hepatica Uher 2000/2452]|jgi:phosphinothricin acetyltransferase|uniref:GNAT family N-acetyltransferase n=1 Tax=Drouetiella hepatica Uher 2000/2452 TaxID=904376 RepID=A0A951UN66_9CYAN|nr:GNAT family N-acetyltransferase [Drouetiella hepatica Uher 2000/2452]
MNIRDAQESDLPAIVEIYNAAIPTRIATADLEPITVESRYLWFKQYHPDKRPLWVLEVANEGGKNEEDKEIAAWISLTSFYAGRPAYSATAEISIYIAPQHQRQGYGKHLIKRLIEFCPQLGVTTLLAMYFDHNIGSQRLFEGLGFQPQGHLTNIAILDGQQRGLIIAALRV